MVGAVRRVEGRPRRLGRDPLRLPRRRRDRASLRQQRLPLHGRRRARPAARAGDRTHRQLVEPGALREADRFALGTGDRPRAPAGRLGDSTFHPTFLYELLYDCAMVGVLLLLDRRFRFKPPALFALYVSVYTFGRFFEELLRIDPSHHIAGLRLNAWVSVVVFVLSTAFFIWWQFFHRGSKEPLPPPKRTTGPAMAIPRGRR